MQKFQQDFISSLVPGAQASQRTYGIWASTIIGQAILESGWGKHQPAGSNNVFGIQASQHAMPSTYVEAESTEFVHGVQTPAHEKFARYPSIAAGIIAHANLIAYNHRYATAMASLPKGPAAYLRWLKQDGYSSTPDYADRVMQLVTMYGLQQYDSVATPVQVA